eukprot:4431296-Pleurochrysis_carterae.AAC.3
MAAVRAVICIDSFWSAVPVDGRTCGLERAAEESGAHHYQIDFRAAASFLSAQMPVDNFSSPGQ